MANQRIGILLSGRGSNAAALIHAIGAPVFPADVAVVISNRPDATGLGIAQAAGVPTVVVDHRAFGRDRAAHEAALDAALHAADVDLVCLAGYMRVLTPLLVDRWSGRMLNIHPSLLPAFPGLDTHRRALAAGVRIHGCTVHLVTEAVDGGPILGQAAVPVLPSDDEAALAKRVLRQEHRLYPAVLRQWIDGQDYPSPPDTALLNPGDHRISPGRRIG